MLDIGQWHDGLLRGETEMYEALARRRGVETRLYMDPCTHKGCGAPFAPLTNPPGPQDMTAVVFEFLDKYLRDAKVPDRPPVEYYVQQRNAYADAPTPAAGRHTLRAAAAGRRQLGRRRAANPRPGSYVSDPAAGFSMAFDQYGTVAASPYVPTDQRLEGPHGFTFRTAPFTAKRDLVGSDRAAPGGGVQRHRHRLVRQAGRRRARRRRVDHHRGRAARVHRALDPAKSRPERPYHTHTNPQPIDPGRFYTYDVEVWPTAYELAPGHRLQLRLTSTDLPTHLAGEAVVDRNNPQDAKHRAAESGHEHREVRLELSGRPGFRRIGWRRWRRGSAPPLRHQHPIRPRPRAPRAARLGSGHADPSRAPRAARGGAAAGPGLASRRAHRSPRPRPVRRPLASKRPCHAQHAVVLWPVAPPAQLTDVGEERVSVGVARAVSRSRRQSTSAPPRLTSFIVNWELTRARPGSSASSFM